MFHKKHVISGRVISSNQIEVKSSDHSRLIPGQKVIIYKNTGRKIMGASGKVLGEKETVLGTGKVQVDGNKTIIKSHSNLGGWSVKTSSGKFLKSESKQSNTSKNEIVCIKPIEE